MTAHPVPDLRFKSLDLEDNRVSSFVESLRPLYRRGELVIKGFTVDPAATWTELAANNAELFRYLIQSLSDLAPELETRVARKPIPDYSMIPPHVLAEQLGQLLTQGGCYEQFGGTPLEARKLAQAFTSCLVDPYREDARVFQIKEQWTPWLCSITWAMFLIANPIGHRWFLVCATDSD